MESSHHIRRATSGDAARLAELADAVTLGSPALKTPAQGFLVSRFTVDDYTAILGRVDHAYVLEADGEVRAFVIAYGDALIGPDEKVNLEVRRRADAPFVLIKQVCVERGYGGRGYAAALYERVRAESGALPQYAAIVLEPYNAGSVAFHERLGFHRALELDGPDGMPRGVWMRAGA